MSDIYSRLAVFGVGVPEVLLPRSGTDLSKWAVIACDQFTQDGDYWERIKAGVDGKPSCLGLIYPEVYLEKETLEARDSRIRNIKASMNAYLEGGIFAPARRCCVYLERSTPRHAKRRGIVLLVDLDRYDWAPEARPLIRPTEGTVKERLPPRIEIRRDAPLELPHILLLMDDKDDRLIPSVGKLAANEPPLYETPLMANSGSVSGWAVDSEEALSPLADGLERLAARASGEYPSGVPGEAPFLFAVGDGNHSLATAKAVWEEYKKTHAGETGLENHPARWAMVEVENLYDPGIEFEPIHRVVFGAEPPELLDALSSLDGLGFELEFPEGRVIRVENRSSAIVTAALEPLLDDFIRTKGCSVDYIHGKDEVRRITGNTSSRAVGLLLPSIEKEGLFGTVAKNGPLPRKSFSMGEAEEKRFYLECRKLFR